MCTRYYRIEFKKWRNKWLEYVNISFDLIIILIYIYISIDRDTKICGVESESRPPQGTTVSKEESESTVSTINTTIPIKVKSEEEEEYPDMMAYEDESLALDSASSLVVPGGGEGVVRSARRYDVSIVYDKYYRTPRVFLFGYDENNSPLSPESIFDDVMTDYANRTVTLEAHPHLSMPHASIHPCQHGAAMKRVLEALQECNSVPSVDQYLFIFLKFLQSVIPTIEYDYTVDVQFRKMGI